MQELKGAEDCIICLLCISKNLPHITCDFSCYYCGKIVAKKLKGEPHANK